MLSFKIPPRDPAAKGVRQTTATTNNPSTIDSNQQLSVRLKDLGEDDAIVPETARLAFTIMLESHHPNRTVVQNLGRAIIKKTVIKISGNEVLLIDDYRSLEDSLREEKCSPPGIDTSANRNATKI